MADETTEEQQGQEQQETEGSALRQERDRVAAENKELKSQLRTYAFRDAGLDPEKGVGKLVAKAYDGPADADAIRQYLTDNEISVDNGSQQEPGETEVSQSREPSGEEQETQQAIGRVTQMRTGSQPVEGNRVSTEDWLDLQLRDRQKAQDLFDRGLVDLPPHLANELATG